MKTFHEGPVLKSKTRTGKTKYWQGMYYGNAAGDYFIMKKWWQEGSVEQVSAPYLVEPKNLGKANETTPEAQARAELESLYNKQRDKGYSEDGSKDHIPIKPMLAQKYSDRKHNIVFPCYVQPKLDGFRMLTDGDRAWTRGGKEHVPECVAHLMFDTQGEILDGELVLPGFRPLQEVSRAAKKFRPGVSDQLEYWVYDLVSDEDFEIRFDMLLDILNTPGRPTNVKIVPTFSIPTETEVGDFHQEFLEQGYEGTMIRNRRGAYDIGHRSPDLQKLKDFQDSEFLVVDITDGKGSFEGLALVVCATPNDKRFIATPRGTFEYRADIFKNREQYIGKYLTVRYQYLSEDGVPVGNTVGIDFRDPEEF